MKSKSESLSHELKPEHEVLSDEDKRKMLAQLRIGETSLPKIYSSDPALDGTGVKPGQVVRIHRKDFVGQYDYYRIVIKG